MPVRYARRETATHISERAATVCRPFCIVCMLCVLLFASCRSYPGSIGAVLGKHNTTGQVTVRDAPTGFPAANAGILPGDQILTIDGLDAQKLCAEQIREVLSGPSVQLSSSPSNDMDTPSNSTSNAVHCDHHPHLRGEPPAIYQSNTPYTSDTAAATTPGLC